MAITSITVGVTHNVGNYESVKIEATASICEECNYDEQKNELIDKLIELKELSKNLLNGNQLTTKPSFAPKPNPVQQVAAEPAKPTFAPKANPAQQVAGKPKNPFAKKPEATTAQQQPTYNPITLEPLPPQEPPF